MRSRSGSRRLRPMAAIPWWMTPTRTCIWDQNWKAYVLPGEVFGNTAYYRNTLHQANMAGAR